MSGRGINSLEQDPGAVAASRRDPRAATETLALLYRQSAPAMYFSVAVATLLAIALWPVAERSALLLWCGAVLLAFALRAILFVVYGKRQPQGMEVLRWRLPYVATLLFSGAVWGIGGVWIMPAESLTHQALTFAFLCGMAGSALTAYSAVRSIALSTFAVTLLPIVLWFFVTGGAPRVAMAVGGLLFFMSSIRATRILADALCRSIELTHALDEARAAAETAARTDGLTGLSNRRAFYEQAAASVEACRRRGAPVAALLIDIDHFKRVNDTCGHASGDEVLLQLGRLLRDTLRAGDSCGRLGGEEFGVLLPDTDADAAARIAEHLRLRASAIAIEGPDGAHPVSISVGLATRGDTLETLLRDADTAMYRAKVQGRNRVALQDA